MAVHDTCGLDRIRPRRVYKIAHFARSTSEYATKLNIMGFIVGTTIELAPVGISDPMVFDIRGSRISLRKKEAREIIVREVK